jgi:VanZ family protein
MQTEANVKSKILFKIAEKPKNQKCFVVFATLSLATMVGIFLFSAQPAELSAALSGELAGRLEKLLNAFSWLLSEGVRLWIKTYIRKIAHFMLYALLGSFVSSALLNTKIKKEFFKYGVSAAVCLFYSITDEIHQLFVDGRSGEIRDVLLDFSGAITGIFFVFVIYKIICISSKNSKKI